MSTDADRETFHGKITVASQIIDYLSSGLYKDPASCLKELINNSFDADAVRVNVLVKPDAEHIIIEDDGEGMNKADFIKHFSRISESHKRDKTDRTRTGRKKIGKIGIGFIAANEICDVMEIFSTQKGSTDLLHVRIDFEEMRDPIEKRRRGETDLVKADYMGEVLHTNAALHYTHIFLHSVRGAAREILASAKPQAENATPISLYGATSEAVTNILRSGRINTWKDLDSYSETMLKIALNVPVRYAKNWVPRKHSKAVRHFEKQVERLNFQVFYDGTELRKPIVFRDPSGRSLIKLFKYEGEDASADGYFFVQRKTIKPYELQGLLTRIRHAAVGEYDSQFWGFSQSESPLIQRWVSSEVWADDRLEDAMNIDRRTLRDTHPAYVELRAAIHKFLRKVLKEAREKIYEAGSAERKRESAKQAEEKLKSLIGELRKTHSTGAAQALVQELKSLNEKERQHFLLKKYDVIELYEITTEVAKGILTQAQLKRFLGKLTRRLRQ